MEETRRAATETTKALTGFAERTGANVFLLEDTSPIETPSQNEDPEHRKDLTILGRIIKQAHKDWSKVGEAWDQLLPSRERQHTEAVLNLTLDWVAEALTGGRIKTAGAIGQSMAKTGARLAVTFDLDHIIAPDSKLIPRKSVVDDVPGLRKIKDELGSLDAWLENPAGKFAEAVATIGAVGNKEKKESDLKEVASVIMQADKDMQKLGKPLTAWADWAEKTVRGIVGDKIPDAMKKELALGRDFLHQNKRPLTPAAGILTFAPGIGAGAVGAVAGVAFAGLVGSYVFKQARAWALEKLGPGQEKKRTEEEMVMA